MTKLPKLNLPKISLRCKRTATDVQFWDSLRGKWLVLTPEEWVRRHIIGLFERMGYGAGDIAQEVPVDMHGADQRADIVVYLDGKPYIVCECKEPDIKIKDNSALDQAVRYNYILGASVIMITNGFDHLFYERNGSEYRQIELAEFLDRYKRPNR